MFLNETETIGQILTYGSNTITGSLIATLFLILLFLIVACMMFQIPLEFASIIIFPFCIAVASETSNFFLPIIMISAYFSVIIAKNWFFR